MDISTLQSTLNGYMQRSDDWREKMGEKIEKTLLQATTTNGRVNSLEETNKTIAKILEKHEASIATLSNTRQQFIGAMTLFSFISAFIIGVSYYAATKYAQEISTRTVAERIPIEIEAALSRYEVKVEK